MSFLQMLSMNDLDSPKFFCRKALNSVQVMEVGFLSRLRRLNYAQHTLMFPWRKEVVKRVRLNPVTPAALK